MCVGFVLKWGRVSLLAQEISRGKIMINHLGVSWFFMVFHGFSMVFLRFPWVSLRFPRLFPANPRCSSRSAASLPPVAAPWPPPRNQRDLWRRGARWSCAGFWPGPLEMGHGNPWEPMGILEKGGPWQPWMEIKSGNMMEHDHCVKLGCVFVVVFFGWVLWVAM